MILRRKKQTQTFGTSRIKGFFAPSKDCNWNIPSWELFHIRSKGRVKNHCPFPKVRYVSPLEGSLSKQGNRCIFDIFSHSDAHEPNIQHMQKLPLAHHKDVSLANVTSKLVGFSTGGGNCGTLRIPTKDWGTLGKIR